MLQRVSISVIFFLIQLGISAQEVDSVHVLSGVEIKADRISVFSTGLKVEHLDSVSISILPSASIAGLLSAQSCVFLHSNGTTGLSTLTMRGTNASQSAVYWNGINLSQPNMGMTDVSRISSFDFGDVALQSGGASALLGPGVIGGSLHLTNKLRFSQPLQLTVNESASNIGEMGGGLKFSFGNNHIAYLGTVSGANNKNDFYYTTFTGQRERLPHAEVGLFSANQQMEYSINSHQSITAACWYQTTDRQIPPTMTMDTSDQQQWDRALRCSLQWSLSGTKESLSVRTAYIDEKEHFKSETAWLDEWYHISSFLTEIEHKHYFGQRFTLGSGLNAHLIRADVPAYKGIRFQPDASLWIGLVSIIPITGITAAINLRQDVARGYHAPFCPALSANIPLSKKLTVSLSISRNYRIPTMNDRYWIPGGNPNLKSERSVNMESGIAYNFKQTKYFESKLSLNLYSLFVDNLIQWVPGKTGLFEAVNVQKVWSRGLDLSSKTDWHYGRLLKGYFRFAYNYSPSTFEGNKSATADVVDKQLIYVPLHKLNETFYISANDYYSMIVCSFTGKRFVQTDNNKSLPAFSLFDMYVGKNLHAGKKSIRLQLSVRNILNTHYQSMLYYPEPGRSISVNILITL